MTGIWQRFWFLPADPTTLGLIRIVAGSLVLYVHLAYCLELMEFFGPQAWLTQEAVNRERHEQPVYAPPLGWQQPAIPLHLPETPHRRAAIFNFLRRLPDDPNERMNRLLYLSTLFQNIAERREPFTQYAHGKAELIPATERQESDRLLSLMGPPEAPAFGYFLDWFHDLDTTERFRTLDFIKDLPRSRAEREQLLNYYEFWNVDPRPLYAQGKPTFSPWFHVHDLNTMRAIHGLILVVLFLFTIGLWTRVTSVLAWLTALGYMHRAAPVMFGLDSVMAVLLLYLMVGPSGAALSVDRLRARFRAARALTAANGKAVPWAEATLAGPRPSALANMTLRLLQIHFCLIYASTGFAKLKGATWWNHTAGWMTLVNPDFSLVYNRTFEALLHTLAESRLLLAIVTGSVVIFTLGLEIFFPILVWTRLRPVFVVGAVLLHSGIAIVMGLTPFGLIMMAMLLAFIPATVVRQAPNWIIRRGEPIILRFNRDDPVQYRRMNRIRALDVARQVILQPATSKEAIPVTPDQLQSLALLRPFRWLPGSKRLAKWLLR